SSREISRRHADDPPNEPWTNMTGIPDVEPATEYTTVLPATITDGINTPPASGKPARSRRDRPSCRQRCRPREDRVARSPTARRSPGLPSMTQGTGGSLPDHLIRTRQHRLWDR